uniref:Uncharacterized protein n=1 Tax=Anguilla anguilla TaxID=7936 RepID=A0A0E9UD01_ANGAN
MIPGHCCSSCSNGDKIEMY